MSEHYVYANDDYYPIKEQLASQYFTDDGRPVKNKMSFDIVRTTPGFLKRQLVDNKWVACCRKSFDVLKDAYGFDLFKTFPVALREPFYARCRHMPNPCVKSDVRKLLVDCGIDKMRFSIARDFGDVMMCVVNAFYVSCVGADGNPPSNITLPYDKEINDKLNKLSQDMLNEYLSDRTRERDNLCMNDTNDETRAFFANWLDTMFPDKCKYEV